MKITHDPDDKPPEFLYEDGGLIGAFVRSGGTISWCGTPKGEIPKEWIQCDAAWKAHFDAVKGSE